MELEEEIANVDFADEFVGREVVLGTTACVKGETVEVVELFKVEVLELGCVCVDVVFAVVVFEVAADGVSEASLNDRYQFD